MPKYSVTIAQDTFLLLEAKRLGTDEADALRILIEVAMTREPKQHCASPSSVSQIFYPVPTPYRSSRPEEMTVLVWQRSFFRSALPKRTASKLI
jgi:hypothetical protein